MKKEYTKLPKAFKEKWIDALRSGEYKQTEATLKGRLDNESFGYCCLGVAAEIIGCKNIENIGVIAKGSGIKGISKVPKCLVESSQHNIGFENPEVRKLVTMNDGGDSFKVIANWIEKNL